MKGNNIFSISLSEKRKSNYDKVKSNIKIKLVNFII